MLRGYLDAVTSSGHIEGWAYDTQSPFSALQVAIVAEDGRELGRCLACGYREDLLQAGYAAGWCAFRTRLTESPTGIRSFGLLALDNGASSNLIAYQSVPYVVREETPIQTVSELFASDPTQIGSLEQLRGCNELFSAFIKLKGVDAFVRAAYVYLLARTADPSGLAAYRRLLRSKKVTPYGLLLTIANSDEYRSRIWRQHCAPMMRAFPFRVD